MCGDTDVDILARDLSWYGYSQNRRYFFCKNGYRYRAVIIFHVALSNTSAEWQPTPLLHRHRYTGATKGVIINYRNVEFCRHFVANIFWPPTTLLAKRFYKLSAFCLKSIGLGQYIFRTIVNNPNGLSMILTYFLKVSISVSKWIFFKVSPTTHETTHERGSSI